MRSFSRPSLRDSRQDYAGPGTWFLTIKCFRAAWMFGDVIGQEMHLNEVGLIARRLLLEIPKHFEHAFIDEFMVMPNHVHLILALRWRDPKLSPAEDCERKFGRPVPGTVSTIINAYKGAVTKAACRLVGEKLDIWQSGFVDTLIRSRQMLEHKRAYIRNNPANWGKRLRRRVTQNRNAPLPTILPGQTVARNPPLRVDSLV